MPPRLQTQNLPMTKEEVAYWLSEINSSEDFQRDQFINRIGYDRDWETNFC